MPVAGDAANPRGEADSRSVQNKLVPCSALLALTAGKRGEDRPAAAAEHMASLDTAAAAEV